MSEREIDLKLDMYKILSSFILQIFLQMYILLYTMFHSTTCNMADSGPHHTVLHLVKLQSICIMKTPDPLSQIDHRSQVT